MNKTTFNRQEKAILKTLFDERRPMSLKELSEKSDMSWITTKKYVKSLENHDIVLNKKENKKSNERFALNFTILR